jgi:FlaG/FlaF family flagellin (archaellin)
MRAPLLLACIGAISVGGMTMIASAQTPAAAPEKLVRTSTSFDLMVHQPYAKTAPLFTPEGERAWAGKHWDPQFIYPQPAHDEQGAVFAIQHGPLRAIWVTTQFDIDAKHFQYVYFVPEIMVTVIDVRFTPVNADKTGVNVVYTRTALTAEGNEHVATMTQGDQSAGREWQASIDEYLARSEDPTP